MLTLMNLSCLDNKKTESIELTNKSANLNHRELAVYPGGIHDTLVLNEKSKQYETSFMEHGFGLRSFLYQGIVNGQNFAIKTNCTDATIVVYMKQSNKWQIIDSIAEGIGWNFKTFITTDLNKDNYHDVILIDFDGFRRVVFIYNKLEKIIEHKKEYDRTEER
jgi:hypothetical protein